MDHNPARVAIKQDLLSKFQIDVLMAAWHIAKDEDDRTGAVLDAPLPDPSKLDDVVDAYIKARNACLEAGRRYSAALKEYESALYAWDCEHRTFR